MDGANAQVKGAELVRGKGKKCKGGVVSPSQSYPRAPPGVLHGLLPFTGSVKLLVNCLHLYNVRKQSPESELQECLAPGLDPKLAAQAHLYGTEGTML